MPGQLPIWNSSSVGVNGDKGPYSSSNSTYTSPSLLFDEGKKRTFFSPMYHLDIREPGISALVSLRVGITSQYLNSGWGISISIAFFGRLQDACLSPAYWCIRGLALRWRCLRTACRELRDSSPCWMRTITLRLTWSGRRTSCWLSDWILWYEIRSFLPEFLR